MEADLAEQAKRLGPGPALPGLGEHRLEGLARPPQLAGVEPILGGPDRPAPGLGNLVGRSQKPRPLGEGGGGVRRPSAAGVLGGLVQDDRRLLVRLRRRQRQVPGTLLELTDGLGEACVHSASLRPRRGRVDRGGEERMREADLRAVEADDPRVRGTLERRPRPRGRRSGPGGDQLHRRRRKRSGREQCPPRTWGQAGNPRLDQLAQVVGDRQGRARRQVVRQ